MINLENKLLSILKSKKQLFGRGLLYQSFPELKIRGQRSSSKRFKTYKLDKIINNQSKVLDIGCNCGFMSLITAKRSKFVYSVEPNETLIKIAKIVKDHLKIKNCTFINSTFDDFKTKKKFNLIFSFAVHHWVNFSFFFYVKKLSELLEMDGIIVFESHKLDSIDRYFIKKVQILKNLGFELEELNEIYEKKDMKRLFGIFVKKKNFMNVSIRKKIKSFLTCYWIIFLDIILNKVNNLTYPIKGILLIINKVIFKNAKT